MQQICFYCRKEFTAQRASAKYCSDNCRAAYNRITDKAVNKAAQIQTLIDDMELLLENFPELANEIDKAMADALNYIHAMRRERRWACACGVTKNAWTRPERCTCGNARYTLQRRIFWNR